MTRNPGRNIPLSAGRRLMCDMMRASQSVPLVAIERRIHLGPVTAARAKCAVPPSWWALFVNAYALMAMKRPQMRRSYIRFPWPRLFEHAYNVAIMPVERMIDGEDVVLFGQLWCPEEKSLAELHDEIQRLKKVAIEDEPNFRSQMRLSRLPGWLRRLCWWLALHVSGYWRMVQIGTFGITGLSGQGASSLHFLSPLTSTFAVTVIEPDDTALVRLMWDHRVVDGVVPALATRDFEDCLNYEIVRELEALPQARVDASA